MKLHKNSAGFSPVIVVVIVGIVGILGFAAYNVYSRSQDKNTASTPSTQTTNNVAASDVPAVNSSEDLNAAEKLVDQTNVGSTQDDTQLDADLATF